VIRVDLDRTAVKRKEENEGFSVQVHPMAKEENNVRFCRLGR